MVRVSNNNASTMLILNMGAHQACVLSPVLYSLFTHDCIARHDSNPIIELSEALTVEGLITDNHETAYGRRSETWPCGVRITTSPSE